MQDVFLGSRLKGHRRGLTSDISVCTLGVLAAAMLETSLGRGTLGRLMCKQMLYWTATEGTKSQLGGGWSRAIQVLCWPVYGLLTDSKGISGHQEKMQCIVLPARA